MILIAFSDEKGQGGGTGYSYWTQTVEHTLLPLLNSVKNI